MLVFINVGFINKNKHFEEFKGSPIKWISYHSERCHTNCSLHSSVVWFKEISDGNSGLRRVQHGDNYTMEEQNKSERKVDQTFVTVWWMCPKHI